MFAVICKLVHGPNCHGIDVTQNVTNVFLAAFAHSSNDSFPAFLFTRSGGYGRLP